MKKYKKFVLDNPKSQISETFRTLRTNLQFLDIDRELKTIVITSSGPAEGKSTVAVNLAISMAQLDRKVLIMDCDLRKPVIHRYFKGDNRKGLTNILVNKETVEENVVKAENIDNVDLLLSGPIPPNPSELLNSKSMKSFLEKIRDDYDFIVIDSPPVGIVSDSTILSTLVDGTILVVEAGVTDRTELMRAKEHLEQVDSKILGTILNKMPIKKGQEYTYYGEE